ncbi:MAG: Zn-dependent oligopeptidase [FCB group bacterium]|nr:Zn-dependent oligopeptidase [FCB group bacterium]
MKRYFGWTTLLVFLLIQCTPKPSPSPAGQVPLGVSSNPLLVKFNEVNRFSRLKTEHIPQATDITLDRANNILDGILSIPDEERTFDNTVKPIDEIYAVLGRVENPIYLMGAVHPDEAVRTAADSSILKFSKWETDFSLNEDLFRAVQAYGQTEDAQNLTGVNKRFYDDVLKDFLRQGFGLSKEKRDQVRELKNRISKLGLEFDNNIAQYTDTLVVTEEDMDGTPENYKKAMAAGDGTYKIDISYPSRRVFMKLSNSESARKALSEKFLNRAAEKNLKVIPEMVAERQKLANVLGYSSYAAYILDDRMPKTPDVVWKFEADLKSALKDKMSREHQELLDLKTKVTGEPATEINYWELHYLENKLAEEKYTLDEQKIREFFELNNVIDGLFTVAQTIYGLKFQEVPNPSVWHPDVTMYSVTDKDSGNLLGYFYFDLFPRENKYSHAAHFGISKGMSTPEGYQYPIAALVCNFPKPTEDQPSLLPHSDVETFFHEFGHLLHGMVTESALYSYSGTGVDRDFVEAPSQFFENWTWHKESLRLFAKHYQTDEVIPDSLLDRMLAAKNMSSGGDFAFQVFLGSLDMTLYDKWSPESSESVLDVSRRLHREILDWNETPNTARIASFGHLNGYAASYYGYAWSKVFAEDMFSVFAREGMMNPKVGKRFRETVLAPGGTREPMDLVRDFLGREPNNEAFKRSLGL